MNLYVEQVGAGPDVLLLHGWGLHGGIWRPIAQRLGQDCRVTMVDLPGHGHSRAAAGEFRTAAVAEAVSHAAPPGAVWVGWSLGGMVTLAAAAMGLPLRGIVITGAAARFAASPDWPCGMAADLLAQFASDLALDYELTLRRFVALQSRGAPHAREQIRCLRAELAARGAPHPDALAGGLAALRDDDARPRLHRIQQPVLLIHGERDLLVPIEAARATARLLARARLVTIAAAGHAPFLSHPDEFLAAVLEYVHERAVNL